MQPAVSIPKPCHENWNKMTAAEQGRHCQVCCKTVVDFSQRSNDEIAAYIRQNAEQRICGRFRKEQVKTSAPRPRYRLFMAALYFVFGGFLFSSCGTRSHTNNQEHLMGRVAPNISGFAPGAEDTLTKKKVCKKPVVAAPDSVEIYMLGEVVSMPENK